MFRTPIKQKKMIQTKLIKTIDEDKNLPFGDIQIAKNPNETRLLFINTNGLELWTDAHSLNELCSNSKSQQYNIRMIAKTNTHWKNICTKDKFRIIISKQCTGALVTTLETNLPWHSIYKPGGIATITDILIRSRKTQSGEEDHGLGRCSFITLQWRNGRKVTIISVYKVRSTIIDPTKTNTALTQQYTILYDKLDKESIASLIITHLALFITKRTKLNHEFILGIDANEAFTFNAGDIARLWKKCNLIEPISTKHGTTGEPNTYTRCIERIYYFFCTSIIYKLIYKCRIIPFCSIITSDHRCLYMDVNITQYRRNPFVDLAKNHTILLSSTHPKKCLNTRKFSSNTFYLEMQTKSHQNTKKINNKSLHESDMKDINNLDIINTKGTLISEKKLKRTYITANGLKKFITASCVYLTGDSLSHKS